MPRRNDPIPPATYVQVWDEPSEADRSLMREIMSHGPVVGGMHLAWSMTLRDGLERGFWI